MIERRAFRAMGTDVELFVDASKSPDRVFDRAAAEFERLEELLSRFRPGSELSRLNRERRLEASPDLCHVLQLALEARERSSGRFDPTVHDAVVAAGYDRSFELLAEESDEPASRPVVGGGGVHVAGSCVELDEGVHVDLGGIGKGFAAERAAELLVVVGPCLVNAGGDVAVRGGRWPIGVETPDGLLTLELAEGGLATSGRDRRRWRRAGHELHHVIDPRTGTSAEGDLLRVTAVASDAVEAEVVAKSLFLVGADRAISEARDRHITAVLVTDDGGTHLLGAAA